MRIEEAHHAGDRARAHQRVVVEKQQHATAGQRRRLDCSPSRSQGSIRFVAAGPRESRGEHFRRAVARVVVDHDRFGRNVGRVRLDRDEQLPQQLAAIPVDDADRDVGQRRSMRKRPSFACRIWSCRHSRGFRHGSRVALGDNEVLPHQKGLDAAEAHGHEQSPNGRPMP